MSLFCDDGNHPFDALIQHGLAYGWVCNVCGTHIGTEEEYVALMNRHGGVKEKASACECGGAKAGYPRGNVGHAHWCPERNP